MDLPQFDACVVAQYFQPPHASHLAVIEQAGTLAAQVFVICLGAGSASAVRTPFTSDQRCRWIIEQAPVSPTLGVVAIVDDPYRPDQWRNALERAVTPRLPTGSRVAVLSDAPIDEVLPPSWQRVKPEHALHAVEDTLRQHLFQSPPPAGATLQDYLVPAQHASMVTFMRGAEFASLRAEASFVEQFHASWANSPYPPTFVTTDGVITWRGRIALIQRGRAPGKGLWALPGGFLDGSETLLAGVMREIEEETGLQVSAQQLRSQQTFDQPQRSLRGRTITHAFHFRLDGQHPPRLTAADDAAEAEWFELDSVKPELLFEDHYAILQAMLGVVA